MFRNTLKHIILLVFVAFSYSTLVSQHVNLLTNDPVKIVKVYPNPASDYFSITLDQISNNDIKMITVDNIVGKEVKKFYTNEANKYSLSGLKRGMYIVRVFDKKDRLVRALRLSKN